MLCLFFQMFNDTIRCSHNLLLSLLAVFLLSIYNHGVLLLYYSVTSKRGIYGQFPIMHLLDSFKTLFIKKPLTFEVALGSYLFL